MSDATLIPLGSSPRNQWRVSATEVDLRRTPMAERPLRIEAAPQRLTLDLTKTAIIVVDMQNDFCHPEGWLGHIGVDVTPARAPIPHLAKLLPALRKADVPVLWLNWGNRPDRLNLPPKLLHVYKPTGIGTGIGDPLPGSGAHVLEDGSWSAAVVDELAPEPGDIHVAKFRMSGFWDTELDSILRNLAVTTLLFAGVNVDQCVLGTLLDASCLGYDCILLEDCSATTSPDYCFAATVYNVKQCFGFVAQSSEFLTEAAAS
ncbi:cysteine hydrolase family protein [Acidisoma cellulosilyticum]|nr:cysteine hydrolase family protein [Acidisoma cellulosilyticum]